MSNYDVFISYARDDNSSVGDAAFLIDTLVARLSESGFTVWIDHQGIPQASNWEHQIRSGIQESDNFLLILSPNSLGSRWVHLEIQQALQFGKRIIPLFHSSFDEKHEVYKFRDYDWRQIAEQNWDKLVRLQLSQDLTLLNTFETAVEWVISELHSSPAHQESHKQLLQQTSSWLAAGRGPGTFIRGEALQQAEQWIAEWDALPEVDRLAPQPTDDQRAFLAACRAAETENQRLLEEQISHMRDLQERTVSMQRQARILITAAILAALMGGLALIAMVNAAQQTQRAQQDLSISTAAQGAALDAQASAIAQAEVANQDVAAAQTAFAQIEEELGAAENSVAAQSTLIFDAQATATAINQDANVTRERAEVLRMTGLALLEADDQLGSPETAALLAIRALTLDPSYYMPLADDVLTRILPNLGAREIYSLESWGMSAVFNPDGQTALITSNDGDVIRLLDLGSRQILHRYWAPEGDLHLVAFHPEGHTFASTAGDSDVLIWNVASGEILQRLEGHRAEVTVLRYNAAGNRLLTGSVDGTLRLWNLETGEVQETFDYMGNAAVLGADLDSRGTYVIAVGEYGYQMWSARTGEEIYANSNGWYFDVAFSPDGQYFATASWSESGVQLWDSRSFEMVRHYEESERADNVRFSPFGTYLASGEGATTIGDVRVWAVDNPELMVRLSGHSASITAIDWSSSSSALLSVGGMELRTWDLNDSDGNRVVSMPSDYTGALAYLPNSDQFLTGSDDRRLRLWDASSGNLVRVITLMNDWISDISVSADGQQALVGDWSGNTSLLTLSTGRALATFTHRQTWIASVALSPDGLLAASGGGDGQVYVWDISTGQRRFILHEGEEVGEVSALIFTPDSRYLLAGSQDRITRMWDVTSGEVARQFTSTTESHVRSIALSPDGNLLVTGSDNPSLHVYHFATGQFIREVSGHIMGTPAVTFAPTSNDLLLVSGSSDRTIRVWRLTDDGRNVDQIRQLAGHQGDIARIVVSPDARYIVSSTAGLLGDGTVRIWDLTLQAAMAYACERIGRDFSIEERQRFAISDLLPACVVR